MYRLPFVAFAQQSYDSLKPRKQCWLFAIATHLVNVIFGDGAIQQRVEIVEEADRLKSRHAAFTFSFYANLERRAATGDRREADNIREKDGRRLERLRFDALAALQLFGNLPKKQSYACDA